MSEVCLEKTARSDSPQYREPPRQSPYIATATETIKNYAENWGGVWFNETCFTAKGRETRADVNRLRNTTLV